MTHPQKLLQSAVELHQSARIDEAEKAYLTLLNAHPTNSDGLRLLGGLYLQTGQYPKAVDFLQRAVNVDDPDAETLTNYGIALRAVGNTAEALVCYKRVLKKNPNYVTALTNMGSLYQDTGRLNEALDAHGQVLRLKPESAVAHFNYGNVLSILGRMRDAITRYEHALQLKPDYLEAMINLGMGLSRIGKGEESHQWLSISQSWFEKALKLDPHNVSAMNNIGNVWRQKGDPEKALLFYQEALRLRPDYPQAMLNMATSLRDLKRYNEAIESCKRAIVLMPTSSDPLINLGSYLHDLARYDEALEAYDRALKINPDSVDARWNKSLSLLCLGRYKEGWQLHEIGLGIPHMRGEYPSPERKWNGQNFEGKRLLIWSEQGFGDSLQFVRYAELCKARGGQVIVQCPRNLRNLFRNCSFIDALPESVSEEDFDYHAPMMSLPFIFQTTIETIPTNIPYLKVSEAKRAEWAQKFSVKKNMRVGLVWAGNPRENALNANLVDRRRSMALETLRPLFDIGDIDFFSLQMGGAEKQIEQSGLHARMINLMSEVKDFEDTAALIENLDLVISVDTSVVHVSGGLGKPTWVLSRLDACWRWLQNRPDSLWYPQTTVFGQTTFGDWDSVILKVRDALYNASMTTKA